MPFIKTALLVPNDSAKGSGHSGEVNHYNLVRLRATGFGKVKIRLFSLDEVDEDQCPDIILNKTSSKEPRSLANFTSNRAGIELKTTTINEYIDVNSIILYSRWVAAEYPE